MLFLGLLLGVLALWLEGWGLPFSRPGGAGGRPGDNSLLEWLPSTVGTQTSFVAFYGVAFFALRWWRAADRRRPQRFSLVPVLASSFWALGLSLVFWPGNWSPALSLVFASGIIQAVSPWQKTAPPQARRLRLRYA